MHLLRATLAILIASVPAAPLAGPPAAPNAPAVQRVVECRAIAADAARLACFDSAVEAMRQAQDKGDLLTIDREQRRAVRRQAFGLSLPSLAIFDRGEKPAEVDTLAAKVASASRDPYGKWLVRLEGGAVWRQVDANELYRAPKAGSAVVINRTALGGFFMKIDGQQAIRVRRES